MGVAIERIIHVRSTVSAKRGIYEIAMVGTHAGIGGVRDGFLDGGTDAGAYSISWSVAESH